MSVDWLDEKDVVTPDDIMRGLQEAIDAGGDRAVLEDKLRRAIKGAGGTIEDLAAAWTRQARYERNLAEFSAEIRRKWLQPEAQKPPPGRSSKPAQPKAPEEEAQAMLRELIRRFPDVARDVLGENGDAQP